jgi:nuclear pore complex protein Nup133
MTQAILYGSYPEVRPEPKRVGSLCSNASQNPLHFSFPPEIDEDSLMSGAMLLSGAILASGKSLLA